MLLQVLHFHVDATKLTNAQQLVLESTFVVHEECRAIPRRPVLNGVLRLNADELDVAMVASDNTKHFVHHTTFLKRRVPKVSNHPVVLASFRDFTSPLVLGNGLDIAELVARHGRLHLSDAAFTNAQELGVIVVVVLELIELVERRVLARIHLLFLALRLLLLHFGLGCDDPFLDEDVLPLGGLARRRVVDVSAVAHCSLLSRHFDCGLVPQAAHDKQTRG